MEILTGYTGRSHITPSLDASINTAIFGNNNVVLNFGNKLSFSAQTTGKILIGSGALCFSGRIAVSENSEEKEYTTPATGEYSHCKIVARYKKIVYDGTNIESISLVLLQSVDSASSVTAALNLPVSENASNVIEQSTTDADFVLYDFVVSEGGVVTNPVEPQFKVVDSIVSLSQSTETNFASINNNIEDSVDTLNTKIFDNSSKIKALQNYRIVQVFDNVEKGDLLELDNTLGKNYFILIFANINNKTVPFIYDFSKITNISTYGTTYEAYNGDYTLKIYYQGAGKFNISSLSKRTFGTKKYEGISTGGLNRTTIETLKVEESFFEDVQFTIYKILFS